MSYREMNASELLIPEDSYDNLLNSFGDQVPRFSKKTINAVPDFVDVPGARMPSSRTNTQTNTYGRASSNYGTTSSGYGSTYTTGSLDKSAKSVSKKKSRKNASGMS